MFSSPPSSPTPASSVNTLSLFLFCDSCVLLPPPIYSSSLLAHRSSWYHFQFCRFYIYLCIYMYILQARKHILENHVGSVFLRLSHLMYFSNPPTFLLCGDLVIPHLSKCPKMPHPTTGILAHPCLLLPYSWQQGNRTRLYIYQQKNG